MNKDALSLYGITDRYWLNGRPLIHDVQLALEGGVTMIQLREKNLDEESFKDIRISLQNGKITTLSEENSILS